MARIPLSVIAKEDFAAIRQLCAGRIAETHGAWEWQRDLNHRDEVASGHELVPTQITPAELRDYCRKHNCQADETATRLLTEEKFVEAERRGA